MLRLRGQFSRPQSLRDQLRENEPADIRTPVERRLHEVGKSGVPMVSVSFATGGCHAGGPD